MLAILFKGILFYFLFVFIRNVIFGYKTYQQVKSGMGSGTGASGSRSGGTKKYRSNNDDVLEAEYRVIKD